MSRKMLQENVHLAQSILLTGSLNHFENVHFNSFLFRQARGYHSSLWYLFVVEFY